MSYKGYDFFYTNGSSHTRGGGFETLDEEGFFADAMAEYYKKHYNITWRSTDEVNYATRLSKHIDIKVVNESMQGGGLDRIIRKTYDFIESNWEKRHKFFIILEAPDASRIDLYYKPYKKYFLLNYDRHEQIYGTLSYFPKPKDTESLQDDFHLYANKFYDHREHHYSNERKLMGLYSFCKRHNIAIKLMSGMRHLAETYEQTDILSNKNTDDFEIIEWCIQNKKQIKHETNFEIIDGHPGYFAHIEYAEIWRDWLDKNLEPSHLLTK